MDLAEVLRSRAGIDILGSRSQLGQNLTTSIRGGRNDQVLILIGGFVMMPLASEPILI